MIKKELTTSTGRKIVGWTLISIGVPGLILPIIPGIPLIVVGSSMTGYINAQDTITNVKKVIVRKYSAYIAFLAPRSNHETRTF